MTEKGNTSFPRHRRSRVKRQKQQIPRKKNKFFEWIIPFSPASISDGAGCLLLFV
jgi:hypothetical protein